MDLFTSISLEAEELKSQKYDLPNSDIEYFPNYFTESESNRLYQSLISNVPWQQENIKMYGKEIPVPRLTAWFGDTDKIYTYSGIEMKPLAWTDDLLEIKSRIEEIAFVDFSSVLLNLYRTGKDSVSWHADDETELGINPIIGSVSFGATRVFHLKHKNDSSQKEKINLEHGSFLLMKGETQHFWMHQVPKTARNVKPRINLTFRIIR